MYAPGQLVAALTGVWDDGADHHPPGWFCRPGDILTVLDCPAIGQILVRFDGCDFFVYRHEVKAFSGEATMARSATEQRLGE